MFEAYLNRMKSQGNYDGHIKKTDADDIINESWWEDPQSRVAYLYDYYHDSEMNKLINLHPQDDIMKRSVDIKFIVSAHSTLSNSQIEYYIMFRPGQEELLDYYEESICNSGAEYPIGMYIDIPDHNGIYNRWLIMGTDDGTNIFKRHRIMKCNYYLHWSYRDKLYDMCVVLRYRNSYNSGEWSAHETTIVQNQNLIMLPHNDITQHLYYNQRIIIDSRANTKGLGSYLTWNTSKVETMFPPGIIQLTMAQGFFNEATDCFDPINGYLYADHPMADNLNINFNDDDGGEYSKIIISGKQSVSMFGKGKHINLYFYDKYDNPITKEFDQSTTLSSVWSYKIYNKDGSEFNIADLPIESILSVQNDDLTDVILHIDEEIVVNGYYIIPNDDGEYVFETENDTIIAGNDPFKMNGYILIGKTIALHGHFEDGSCDSDITLRITGL